ncbi:hypothetical protein VTH06DRAFT_5487 [Thermothelomyces fergusii]
MGWTTYSVSCSLECCQQYNGFFVLTKNGIWAMMGRNGRRRHGFFFLWFLVTVGCGFSPAGDGSRYGTSQEQGVRSCFHR